MKENTKCVCGKDVFKNQRCAFHQPATKSGRRVLVTWFHVSDRHGCYHDVVIEKVRPLILSPPCGASVYFINHFGMIDVGFRGGKGVEAWLKKRGMPCVAVTPLADAEYGGRRVVDFLYSSLESFSIQRVEAERLHLSLRAERQLLHYYLNQRGMQNHEEALAMLAMAGASLATSLNNLDFYKALGQEWIEW